MRISIPPSSRCPTLLATLSVEKGPRGSIHETEEMLRVGNSITGVGELVLDNNLIKLQPPKEGFCYFLSRLDYESLLRKQESSVRLWRILTVIFGVAACSTLLYILWKKFAHHRRSKKERSMLEEFNEQQRKRMRDRSEHRGEQCVSDHLFGVPEPRALMCVFRVWSCLCLPSVLRCLAKAKEMPNLQGSNRQGHTPVQQLMQKGIELSVNVKEK